MAYSIGAFPLDSLIATLTNAVALDKTQKGALKAEFQTDPAGVYSGLTTPEEFLVAYCTVRPVPNPEPQGYVKPDLTYDEVSLQALVNDGLITKEKYLIALEEVREEKKFLDPNWQEFIGTESRMDVVTPGLVPSLEEIAEALA